MKPHIVYCGINNNNNMSILVQSIQVKNGLFNGRNNIPLPYICPLFHCVKDIPLSYICPLIHCGDHTLGYVHKRVDGVPYFNKITLTRVFLAMKKIIAQTTISLMEMTFRNVHFNKVKFLCVLLEMKKMIAEPTISLMDMTFSIVHVVVSAPIQPIAVFAKAKHWSTMFLTELLQSYLACNLWFYRKAIFVTSWFHQTAVIAISTTFDYCLIDFLWLHFHQLTDVPGTRNSFLHPINESIDPFHAEATSSPTNSGTFIIPWIASIVSHLVVPFSPAYHPIQTSFGHPFASLLLQPFAVIHTLAPFCASSSVNPLQGLGGDTQRNFDDTRYIFDDTRNLAKLITNIPSKIAN